MVDNSGTVIRGINATITQIAYYLEGYIINKTLDNVTDFSDQEYLSDIFCNSHGNYITAGKRCDCDIGFFGNYCRIPGLSYWGNGWTALQVIFAFFHCLLAITIVLYFKRNIDLVICI